MNIGESHAFDFGDSAPMPAAPARRTTPVRREATGASVGKPPAAAKSEKPASAELLPVTLAPFTPAAPGDKKTWTGTIEAEKELKARTEYWDGIFLGRWREYLAMAVAARDAGARADVAVVEIAAHSNYHHPSSIAGLLWGAGLLRTSDEAMAAYQKGYHSFSPTAAE